MQNEQQDTAPATTTTGTSGNAAPVQTSDNGHPSSLERIENAISAGLGKAKGELVGLERDAVDEFKKLASAMHDWFRKHTGTGPTPSVHLQTAAAQLDAAAETVGVHFAVNGAAAAAAGASK